MNEKGIERPPRITTTQQEVGGRNGIFAIFNYLIDFVKWAQRLQNVFPKVQTFTVTINPSSVPATSDATETVTLNGLTTNDTVIVSKPSDTANLSIVQSWCETNNQLKVKYRNYSGSPIDPPSESYFIVAIRR